MDLASSKDITLDGSRINHIRRSVSESNICVKIKQVQDLCQNRTSVSLDSLNLFTFSHLLNLWF